MDQLISARCNIDIQNECDGSTSLHLAAYQGHETVINKLILAKCNVDLQAKNGATPLHIALFSGHGSVTQQLIAARCNVYLQDINGFTPFHFASQQGQASVTRQLLAARCNVNLLVKCQPGRTALQLAQLKGFSEIVMLLRMQNTKQKGADRAMKASLWRASPETTKKQQEDADRAMNELLEEEGQASATTVTVSQKEKQAKQAKAGIECHQTVAQGQDTEEQKDNLLQASPDNT